MSMAQHLTLVCLTQPSTLLHFQDHNFSLSPKFSLSPELFWVFPPILEYHCGHPWGFYWGAGGKVILLHFKFFIQSHLSQWPKHLTLVHWWIDFTIFEADLASVFFVFTTPNSDRPILRHFCLLLLATENASLICTAQVLGSECKLQQIKALEVECY